MKQLNLGIIGLGRAGGGMHLNELKGKEDMFRIYAVCDAGSEMSFVKRPLPILFLIF
jgi:predicted dehydrogenase